MLVVLGLRRWVKDPHPPPDSDLPQSRTCAINKLNLNHFKELSVWGSSEDFQELSEHVVPEGTTGRFCKSVVWRMYLVPVFGVPRFVLLCPRSGFGVQGTIRQNHPFGNTLS